MTTDAVNKDMRAKSGTVTDSRPLVVFLYSLARDYLPLTDIEDAIDNSFPPEPHPEARVIFTNGWLARWAQYSAERLTRPMEGTNDDDSPVSPEDRPR
jgi:hypothetical protein